MNTTSSAAIVTSGLNNFVSQLMRQAGFDGLTKAKQEQHLQQLTDAINARLGVVVLEQLSNDDRAQYISEFVETNKTQTTESQQFLVRHLPQLQPVIDRELQKFSQEYLQAVKK